MRAAAIKNAIVVAIVLSLGMAATTTLADDSPDLSQPPGAHSTLSTSDGNIRDDKLAEFVRDQIILSGGNVKDVKIIVNSCFGGGLLDDFERVLNALGVPWIGGSASQADQRARGWWDEDVAQYPSLGSMFTSALFGSIISPTNALPGTARNRATDNLKEDLETTATLDHAGPYGLGLEDPVIAWGGGGENINLIDPGTSYEAVVFGGKQTHQRHHNNIQNAEGALQEVWSGAPHNIRAIDGGTTQDLKDAIAAACQNLDENTQLLLYFNDHGDTAFDIGEFLGWLLPHTVSSYLNIVFSLHDGWKEAMQGMFNEGQMPTPTLDIIFNQPMDPADWLFVFNGLPLVLPPGPLSGLVQVAVPWWNIKEGDNKLELVPTDSSSPPMELDHLEVSSGPVDDGKVIEPRPAVLVGHWPLDGFKDGGTKVHDASGNGRDGTVHGDPTLVSGVSAGALDLDGDGDYIVVGPVGISGADPRTIAGWANADLTGPTGRSTVFGFTGPTGGAQDFCVKADGAADQWRIRVGDQEESIIPIDAEWHHFVVTYDGTRVNCYADGVPVSTDSGVTLNTNDDFRIGMSVNNPNSFQGLVDDVAIYDRALTREEIQPLAFPPLDFGQGGIAMEVFQDILGTAVADLTNDPDFQGFKWVWAATMDTFESPPNLDDNYGARLSGWLMPQTSGDYTFWVSSDDASELWLSTDADPANVVQICEVPGWTSAGEWGKYAEQQSAAIPLQGGWLYYLQSLFKEGGGGDHLQVAWEGPDIPGPTIIDGHFLFPDLPAYSFAWEWSSFNDSTFDPLNPASVLENPLFRVELPNIDKDYDWGSQSAYVPEDNVAGRGAGNLEVPATGNWTFYLTADDGANLYIDGQLVIENWNNKPGTEVASEPIPLVAGQTYPIQVLWHDGSGPASIHLSWEGPGIPKEIIPPTAYIPPPCAFFISPPDGAVNVDHQVVLTWMPGIGTKESQVRFGTDPANLPVIAIIPLGVDSYNPGTLEHGQTYHVQIDGGNWDDTITPGQPSSFTVAPFITLDNMEDYTDVLGERIFQTWLDGFGYPLPPPGRPGNFTGSQVGHNTAPFADHTFVYGGLWSMPFYFDNTGMLSYFLHSEAERPYIPPLDLSNMDALTAYFRGPEPPGDYHYSARSDTFTIRAAGADIWDNHDEFHFVYRQYDGDFDIQADLSQIEPGNAWTKAGVMMRETTDADSRFAGMYGTPGQGALFEGRLTTGGNCFSAKDPAIAPPHWVRLVRAGDTITGFKSLNGTDWTGWYNTYPGLPPTVFIGLALTSHDKASTAQATFDSVTVDGQPFAPTGNQDIGRTQNYPDQVYIGIEDIQGKQFVQPHPNPAATLIPDWTEITLDVGAAAQAAVQVDKTAKIFVGVGDRDGQTPGGEGIIYVDNVRAHPTPTPPKQVSLDISSSGAGSVTDPPEGTSTYNEGEEVTVVAVSYPLGSFIAWKGTAVDAGKVADPASPATTVTMDGDYTLEAVFDTVRIDVVVVPQGTGLPLTTTTLPQSWPTVAVGEAVDIGMYAMITDPKCEFALAAVYTDLTCPDDIVSCDSVEHCPYFDEFATGTIGVGLVDELGGCAGETGHGNNEHVLIATVKATVTGGGQGQVTCSVGDTGCAIGAYGLVANEEVSCYECPIEAVADCTCPYDLDADCDIDQDDLDLFGCCFGLLAGEFGCGGSVDCTTSDFDCDGSVGAGDYAFFFTAFGRPWNDPSIVYSECAGGTPCGQDPPPGEFMASDVAVRSLIVASPSASDRTEVLPASISSVSQGQDYYVELWASDVGTTNTGLTSVYIDVDLGSGDSASVESIDHGGMFTMLTSGTVQPSRIRALGGSSLAAAGVGPQWARVATVKMRAEASGPVSCSLAPSTTGVAALGRGLVPWSEIELGSGDECFPVDYSTYNDWLSLGKPDCWCMPYQCEGDADGATETLLEYRIYGKDFDLIVANWKRKMDDAELDPCADIDHKSETFLGFRVYGKDLATVVTNWKKKDTDLAGDCPRPE